MSDNQQTGAADQPTQGEPQVEAKQEQSFTQADVDKIVRERIQRERSKYADYDDLKAKAGESKTLEDRLAEMEKRSAEAEAKAMRSDIAARFGIDAEDRDLFLTGIDEDTLTTQAQRLAERTSERKKQSNVVPKEGTNPKPVENDERAAARTLFRSGG